MNVFKSKQKTPISTSKESRFIQKVLGQELTAFLKHCNATLAGGCLTSIFSRTQINDFDIYFPGDEEFTEFYDMMIRGNIKNFSKVFTDSKIICNTDKASTFEANVKNVIELNKIEASYGIGFNINVSGNNIIIQAIKPSFMTNDENLIGGFDYTVCMARYDFKSEEFEFDPRFLIDLASKELHYNPNCSRPLGSIFRLKKYIDKGFNVSHNEFLKIIMSINKIKFKTYSDLINELDCIPDPSLRMHIEALILYPPASKSSESSKMNDEVDHEEIIEWIDDYDKNGAYIPEQFKNRIKSNFMFNLKSNDSDSVDIF